MSCKTDLPAVDVRRVALPRSGLCVAVIALSGAWFTGSTDATESSQGERAISRTLTVSTIVATPVAAVTFAAPPMVTTPTQTVARFSIFPLPGVASVVEARLIHQVIISLHGGRHGP